MNASFHALSQMAMLATAEVAEKAAEAGQEPIVALTWVDTLIIVIYFALVLGIGFYLKKFAETGEDFLRFLKE